MNDTISRQVAIKAINEDKIDLTNPNVVAVFKATGDFEKVETQVMTCDRHIKMLKDLPSAQPERKRGKWEIYVISMFDGEGCRCSECGLEGVPYWDFCPNCGANMREVSE